MLSERDNANHDTTDEIGHAPISLASKFENEEVADLLSEWNNVNPNMDDSGRTPFPWPAENGCEMVALRQEEESHVADTRLRLREELSEPFSAEPSPLPEPPLKRMRRF